MLAEMEINGVYMKNIFDYLDLPNNMYQGSLTTEKRSDRQYTVEFRMSPSATPAVRSTPCAT